MFQKCDDNVLLDFTNFHHETEFVGYSCVFGRFSLQVCLCCDLARCCVSLILLVPEISGCLCAVHSKFRILTDAPVSNQSRHHINLLNLL